MKCWLTLSCFMLASPLLARGENWPAWRGPRGNGTSLERNLPIQWSRSQNVRWKTPLPGPGNSSPIVWHDRVLITQSLDPAGARRALLCFDRQTGRERWRHVVAFAGKEPTHATNPFCSATPVTDGTRVIASHGSAGVVCCNMDGRELWRRDLGSFIHIWGTAASPILHGDRVILNAGPGERTFLVALDKKTGKEIWRVAEPGGKSGEKGNNDWLGSWSTPQLVTVAGQEQLIMSWPFHLQGHDPATGKPIWTCQGLTRLVYTSPIVTEHLVVAMSGYGGSALAARLGGTGDITNTHRLWHHTQPHPQRIGSGVVVGDHLYMANAGPGVAQCIELKTGKDRWEKRRLGAAFWASLVLADGKLFATDQTGETFVLSAKPEFELLGRNRLEEPTNASLAISDGALFIRTFKQLWCIGPQR